jgi:hypothetical protein
LNTAYLQAHWFGWRGPPIGSAPGAVYLQGDGAQNFAAGGQIGFARGAETPPSMGGSIRLMPGGGVTFQAR